MIDLYNKDNEPVEELYDDAGNPVENLLTPGESEQKVKDAQEEAKEQHTIDKEEIQTKLTEKEEELKQVQEDLQKAGDKDQNFNKLRNEKNKKSEELDGLKEEMVKMNKKIDSQGSATLAEKNNELFSKLANGDKELADKIKFHYDGFVVPDDDNEEKRQGRLKNAHTLATGGQGESILGSDAIGSGGGGNQPQGTGKSGKLSPGAEEVAKNLGLDEKTLRKNKLI